MNAAEQGDLAEVKDLLSAGASINFKGILNRTALHEAARGGNLDVMKWLVEKGVDVNSKDSDGRTALHIAASWGRTEVVQVLRDAEYTQKISKARTTSFGVAAVTTLAAISLVVTTAVTTSAILLSNPLIIAAICCAAVAAVGFVTATALACCKPDNKTPGSGLENPGIDGSSAQVKAVQTV